MQFVGDIKKVAGCRCSWTVDVGYLGARVRKTDGTEKFRQMSIGGQGMRPFASSLAYVSILRFHSRNEWDWLIWMNGNCRKQQVVKLVSFENPTWNSPWKGECSRCDNQSSCTCVLPRPIRPRCQPVDPGDLSAPHTSEFSWDALASWVNQWGNKWLCGIGYYLWRVFGQATGTGWAILGRAKNNELLNIYSPTF